MKKFLTISLFITLLFFSKELFSQKAYYYAKYTGTIGEFNVVLELTDAEMWHGTYYYVKYKKDISFSSKKKFFKEGKKIILYEQTNGIVTGYFSFASNDLDLEKEYLYGKWFTTDGKTTYNVILKKTGGTTKNS